MAPFLLAGSALKKAALPLIAAVALGAAYYFASRPTAPLASVGPGCVGCHVRTSLKLNGPAEAALSKGMHALRTRTDPAVLPHRAAECSNCHAEAHASWKTSAHGRAFTNPIFQHAFQRDRKGWCLNCHAPLWKPASMSAEEIAAAPDFAALYAEGVNCVSCHVRDGEILGARKFPNDAELFHPVRHDPGLKGEAFCAGCHQFNFPGNLKPFVDYDGDDHPMQDVHGEFHATDRAAFSEGCVDCHYHQGEHGLKSRGLPHLAQKIDLTLRARTAPPAANEARGHRIRATITMDELGHHFPTGDLFRIMTLFVYGETGRELYRYDFRKEVRVIDRAVVRDTTLKPRRGERGASRTIDIELAERPARCLLAYRLQGSIEPEIEHDFAPGILRETIYDGPCDSATADTPSPATSLIDTAIEGKGQYRR